jgi:hypothetical protein
MHYRDTWARMLPVGFRWIAYTQPGVIVIPAIIVLSPFRLVGALCRLGWRACTKGMRARPAVRPSGP